MKLAGRRVLIAGSAAPSSSEDVLKFVHALVSDLSRRLAERGANFVISFGKDPKLQGRTDGPSIIFDWTVARSVHKVLTEGRAQASGPWGRLIMAVATEATTEQVPSEWVKTYRSLRESKSIQFEFVDPGWRSGAVRRQMQAEMGDVLIAVSGGEGVEHLAQEFANHGKHVIPLDIDLGASCADGAGGAAKLFGKALHESDRFFRVVAGESGSDLLDRTRTRAGNVRFSEVADAIVTLIEKLVPPTVFYVRLLNKKIPEYAAVEDFFRNVVDPVISDLGLEALEMGIGINKYAWMNQAIFDSLHYSEVALVDLTGVRPNCFMELGYALGNSQRVIITAQEGTKIPFDRSCLEAAFGNPSESVEDRKKEPKKHSNPDIEMPHIVRRRG